MSRMRVIEIAATSLLLLAVACAPVQSPAPVAAEPTTQPTNIPVPVPLENDIATATAVVPLPLSVPPMQVGSLFRYFDGALLDAVPNEGPVLIGTHGGLDNPLHPVTVSDFWIYSVEISNQMYARCVSAGKCTPPNVKDNPSFGDPLFVNYPVVGVNWQQASDYCTYAHGRLPTEAEWEKAASWDPLAKLKNQYPWGQKKPACNLLNFSRCVNKSTSVVDYAQARSPYGAYNMEGNVSEWVSDWYSPGYYASSPAQDPLGPTTGYKRSIRSTSFGSDAYQVDTSYRASAQPSDHRNNLGFRCVVDDPIYFAPFCAQAVYYGVSASPSTPGTGSLNKPCPDPSLTIAQYCTTGKIPVVNVTVNNTPPTLVTVTGLEACNPARNDVGSRHQCRLGVTIHVDASCSVGPSGQPTCPPHYQLDPNNSKQCVSPGGAGACPAGFEYDSSVQCCSSAAGSTALIPLCAAGQHFYNNTCVDDAGGPQEPDSITYTTNSPLTCK